MLMVAAPAGAALCLPHLVAGGALSSSEQLAVVHLVRSIMAQTPPNMDVAQAMPTPIPADKAQKDYPVAAMGISNALTNIIAALALDPVTLVQHANAKCDRSAAGHTGGDQSNGDDEDDDDDVVSVFPGSLCSAVTAELVPLLQPITFSSVSDQVFGSTAGLSKRQQRQLQCWRRRAPGW
jgi:hypothetical protein